jgi:hypothetical protein
MTTIPDPIAAGERIDALLKDDAVQLILAEVKKHNYQSFVTAKSDEERRSAQALAQALEILETTFRSIIDAGTIARTEREKAERSPAPR